MSLLKLPGILLARLCGISVLLILVTVLAGCTSESVTEQNDGLDSATSAVATSQDMQFKEVTAKSGVAFTYRTGEETGRTSVSHILESLGGGVALVDYDGDGRLDMCFPGGGYLDGARSLSGHPPALYRNFGSWTFREVTNHAGLHATDLYSHGCSAADFDNDGFKDLLVTGYGQAQLWHNQGDGTFREVHASASMLDSAWSSSSGWADVNSDGNLDAFIVHYVDWSFDNDPPCPNSRGQHDSCSPKHFAGLPDRLWMSNGDGTFRDASAEVGLRSDGKGLGVVLGDLDVDGDVDAYVANDTTDNFLYLNTGHGVFEETGLLSGAARDNAGTPNGSMGVDFGDFDLDGLPDIGVANFERESFAVYRGEGAGMFLHTSQVAGITALGGLYVSFGTLISDFDRDGDEDILIANGHVLLHPREVPVRQIPLLLINTDARFDLFKFDSQEFLSQPQLSRGLAQGDLDGDDDLDLVFVNHNETSAVVENKINYSTEYFRLNLIGRNSNRDAVGTRAILHTSAGDQSRQIKGGGSYLSQSELALDWGIPAGAEVKGVTIHWPSGHKQELQIEAPNQTLTVIEPADAAASS